MCDGCVHSIQQEADKSIKEPIEEGFMGQGWNSYITPSRVPGTRILLFGHTYLGETGKYIGFLCSQEEK